LIRILVQWPGSKYTRLFEAFQTLFPGYRDPAAGLESDHTSSEFIHTNRFGILEDMSLDTSATDVEENESTPTEDIGSAPSPVERSATSTSAPTLEEDPLLNLISIHLMLREMDAICETTKGFWEEVSNGTMPSPLGAWLTNAAFQAVVRLSRQYLDIVKDAQDLQDAYWGIVNDLNIVFTNCPIEPNYCQFTNGRAMVFAWLPLLQFKMKREESQEVLGGNDHQNPADQISNPDEEPKDKMKEDTTAFNMILRSIGQLIGKGESQQYNGFRKEDINPLLPELSTFLANVDSHPTIDLVFGLQLLLETSKSLLWGSASAWKSNCRLKALWYAKEVQNSLDSLTSQEFWATSGNPLNNKVYTVLLAESAGLGAYQREKRFDLYYQSPWVAGSHMAESLHCAMDMGLRLCNNEGFVAAVLHIYNAIRQLCLIDKISILEDLCELFKEAVFLGHLPTTNFSSHFRRSLGGTLETVSVSSPLHSRQRKTTIGLPKTMPSSGDKIRRFLPTELSLFYKLHSDSYQPTLDFWSRVYANKPAAKLSKNEVDEVLATVHHRPFNIVLQKLKEVGLKDFKGPLPAARINYYTVCELSMSAITEMATSTLKLNEQSTGSAGPLFGFKFVETLLAEVVRHQQDAFLSKKLPHMVSITIARQSLLHIWGDKSLSDLFWKL
jgi:hypothetical protein